MQNKTKEAPPRSEVIKELRARALQLRIDSIRATTASRSGHPTTCLSSADLVAALFFHTMHFKLDDPYHSDNDRFILSKGHGIPVVYAAYKQLGVINDAELLAFRTFESLLEGHPTPRFVYNEAATGSLGQGLAIGAGMALDAQREKRSYTTYVMCGDGELAEGSVWEAAAFATFYKLTNLVVILDSNRLGQSGPSLHGHDVEQFARKFEAFGWETVVIDGHDMEAITRLLDRATKEGGYPDKPLAIVAKTYKGYGVPSLQDKGGQHGKPVPADELPAVITSLHKRFADDSAYLKEHTLIADKSVDLAVVTKRAHRTFPVLTNDLKADPSYALFEKGKVLATRKAFGYALAALGRASKDVVALDADVKNSTFTNFFEKEFPDRFTQCFIAEQTMVGVATGLHARGKIPFAATFGAFFSRAHDQVRMAGIGRNALRLCGSHAGVSIGQDGPSQMALEDLAIMRSIPNSVVLYPSDAVSAYKLVTSMANYHEGISYLRTTRAATDILYNHDEEFAIGGCKVLRQSERDVACIIGAGITLHAALKAYELLKEQEIFVSVIDAYSVKPLDGKTIRSVAQASGKRVITVEDHYSQGGLGEAVTHELAADPIQVKILAVTGLSRSGTPDELCAHAGIDADSIVRAVTENEVFE